MTDIIEKYRNSVIQHGSLNDRVYLMKLDHNNIEATIDYVHSLAEKYSYSKIFAKIPAEFSCEFIKQGYTKEACIPNLYSGSVDGDFLAKYAPESNRNKITSHKETIDEVIKCAKSKGQKPLLKLENGFEFKFLTSKESKELATLYSEVFESYPFPIFDAKYISKTMDENIAYFGIYKNNRLVAASSAEMDIENLNAEMTDFATLPDYRGKGFSLYLLQKMESYIKSKGFKTAYTIARSISYGMNITFGANGYEFGGTLINNTNISGNIESMNVWYKGI